MPDLSEIAHAHQNRRATLADLTARRLLALWAKLPPAQLDAGWDQIAPQMGAVVSAGQVVAARQAPGYVHSAASAQGVKVKRPSLIPEAFAGATREGRQVIPELYSAVTTVKSLIGNGVGAREAMRVGAGYLSVLGGTLVGDAGRSADHTQAVGSGFTYSVRVIHAGACSRCAILAGVKGYRANFQRHPRCQCTSMPLQDNESPDGFFRSPDDYFQSLSPAEQDKVFTNAGAEAIRLGADPMKVVNARRGANGIGYSSRDTPWMPGDPRGVMRPTVIGRKADGTPLTVYTTTEGATRRGSYGRLVINGDQQYRRTSSLRLMPESIISMSSSPAEAVTLLRKYGYLT